jgi:hypothetical protein
VSERVKHINEPTSPAKAPASRGQTLQQSDSVGSSSGGSERSHGSAIGKGKR